MFTLTIPQPASNAPTGLPYGVTSNTYGTKWFATEGEAWTFRDELLDSGVVFVRVIGADAHLAAC